MRAALIALLALIATGAASAEPAKVGKLKPDSAVVFLSGSAGGKDQFGFTPQEIFAAAIDGRDVVQLTFSGYTHNHLAVSPNRRYIASNRYVRGDTTGDGRLAADDFKQMWVIDLETGREWPIAKDMDGGIGGIAWSPDSKWIYFASWTDQAHHTLYQDRMDIYRATVDGRTVQPLTHNLPALMGETDPRKFVSDTAVSHDGKWIAMDYKPAAMLSPTASKARIGLMRVDGSAARVLTDGGPEPPQMRGRFGIGDTDPDFSPDGKRVVFTRSTKLGYVFKGAYHAEGLSTQDLLVVDIDGRNLKNLSPQPNMDTYGVPSWGDNCKILYTLWTDRPKSHRLAQYMNSDGTGVTSIEGLPDDINKVQWLPGLKPDHPC